MKVHFYNIYLIILFVLLSSCNQKSKKKGSISNVDQTEQPRSNKWHEKEIKYKDLLSPIYDFKVENPKIYYFIVSWLGTNYDTPNWSGYYSEIWKEKAMKNGIDCSGFARVMQDQIFNKKIKGGSRGILKNFCITIDKQDLREGDLVFFQAPYSNNKRIVHVGTYLSDGYFVHATSKKSASEGRGLDISNLEQVRWKETLVACGRVE